MSYQSSTQTRRSHSASERQPTRTRQLVTFEDYRAKNGDKALSVQMDIREMGKFYAEHPDLAGSYEPSWRSCWGSDYIPHAIEGAGDALDAMAGFDFPAEVKANARRASRRLTDVFMEVAQLQVQRDLTAGRLDRRKLVKIARHTAAGTYDPNQIRPYRRTIPTPADKPTLAIVASAGNAEMWDDATYIPRVLTLALSVLWACQAAGLHTYAALTQNNARLNRVSNPPYQSAIMSTILATPDSTVSPRAYGVALHRDLWRYGFITTWAAEPESLARIDPLRPEKATPGFSWASRNGGDAVHWAREVLGADLVVAIGKITDQHDADIRLGARFTLDQAVAEIIRQAKRLERAA